MEQVNILVQSSVKPKEKFKGVVIDAGALAIDEEGQQIQDEKIISGIKLGDGNTVWDDLEYLKLTTITAKAWKDLAQTATNSQLVSLPDMNFVYLTISADQLDNATYSKIVKQVVANEIGLNFSLNDTTMTITSNEDKPYLRAAEKSFAAGPAIIDSLTINDATSAHDSFTVKFQDTDAQQQIASATKALTNAISQSEEKLNGNIEKATQEIKDSTYSLGDPSTPSGTASGTVLFPDGGKATNEFFLSGAGTWEKINLVAGSVSYTDPIGNQTNVKTALDELIKGGAKILIQEGTAADTKVYVLGATNIVEGSGDYTLKYNKGVYIDCNTNVLYGGAWNDVAEFRHSYDNYTGGTCVCANGCSDNVFIANKRRMPNAYIVSDTYGISVGQTENNKCPIAIAGRVLAYTNGPLHAGDTVCSSNDGKVCKMHWWEKILYPECIVGYVESIPEGNVWGEHKTPINSRVWVRVK